MISQKGVTLVEFVIGIAVVAISSLILGVILLNTTGIFYKESATIEQGLSINEALGIFRQTVREADGTVTTFQDNGVTFTSGEDTLIVQLASIDSNGDLINGSFDKFVFLLDDDYFRLKIFPAEDSSRKAADRILAKKVTNVLFEYLNNSNPPVATDILSASRIKISIVLLKKSGAVDEQSTATSEARLRN